jgi:hypothetical protein
MHGDLEWIGYYIGMFTILCLFIIGGVLGGYIFQIKANWNNRTGGHWGPRLLRAGRVAIVVILMFFVVFELTIFIIF